MTPCSQRGRGIAAVRQDLRANNTCHQQRATYGSLTDCWALMEHVTLTNGNLSYVRHGQKVNRDKMQLPCELKSVKDKKNVEQKQMCLILNCVFTLNPYAVNGNRLGRTLGRFVLCDTLSPNTYNN